MHSSHNLIVLIELFVFGVLIFTLVCCVLKGSLFMIEKENEYRAALYCRLSSDDAYLVESGSIQTQKTLLTQYCRENNIPIYDTYADDGFSGTNFVEVR